ncbi:type IV pilus secretin PilQ, partial [mine drainage metagenome]
LDVNDFATPVTSVTTRPQGNGARMEIAARGAFEPSAYQSGDEYVVEIAPKQVEKAAGVIGNVTGAEPKYTGARVTFNFQDIPTRSALQLIADVSNLNIVASDSVGGSVTLRLVNVPWDQALAVIMRAKSLGMQRDGNVIWVAPQSELASYERAKAETRMQAEEAAPLVTDYIPISYGKASTIAQMLTQKSLQNTAGGGASSNTNRGFLSSRGSVTFDNRTNTLIVSDIPEKIR